MTSSTTTPTRRNRTPAVVDVDPRIRERRRAVKRTAGRRRLRTLIALGVITSVVLGLMWLVNSSLADVDRVMVEGAVRSDVSTVVDAAGIEAGEPLFDLDLAGAAVAVEQLPWVEDASVERRLNGDVLIRVTERVPVTALPVDGGGLVLVDRAGRQLELVDRWPAGFLPVAGVTADGVLGQPAPSEAQAVVRLVENLPPDLAGKVSQVMADEGVLYLDLAQGGRVKFGDDTGIAEKVISLETIFARVDLRCLYEIDVRVPSAPAIRRLDAEGVPGATVADLGSCS